MNKIKRPLFILVLLLILGFLVRLYKIDNPVADWHSWRQADTSAVTRNYVKYGVNLLKPKYDDLSDVSGKGLLNPRGYRFVEFPVYNLIHFLFAKATPFLTLEVAGRLVTVVTSLLSSLLIFLILRRHFSANTGLLGAFFFLFLPFNIYFSRVILPDPLMVSFFLAALYFLDTWRINHRNFSLLIGIIFSALSILVKPVAVFFLLPVIWIFWRVYGLSFIKSKTFIFSLLGVLTPFALWRIWESRFPEGIPANLWLLNGNHIRFKGAFFRWIFGERIANLILGNWGIYPLITGLINVSGSVGYFGLWIIGAVLYLFTFATGNVQHDYYQIPIIPIICILLAIGSVHLWKTWSTRIILIVCLFFMFSFSWYQIRGYYQVNHWEIVEAGKAVDRITPKDAIVVAPYLGDTAFLYQTNRAGFPFMILPIKDLKDRFNASYYVSVNYDDETNKIMNKYIVIEKTPKYVVVKLEEPIRP